MSSQVKSTDFYKLFSNSSKELFSEKFYEAVNNDSSDLSIYDHECNEIIVHDPRDEMIKIFKKYLRYLEYCKLLHNEIALDNVSTLFNYSLFGMLTHIYGANSTNKISAGFSALELKWTYFDYRSINEPYYLKCKPNFDIVNHNDWDNRKKLYDYYVDHDILFGLAKSIDDKCDYYKKIEEKKSLYEYFEKECPPRKNNCPDFYNKCMPHKPDNDLSKLPCHEKIARERADAQAAERRAAMQHTLKSEQDTEVGPLGHDVPRLGTLGQSVLGITPVLITASALYKYTPIGSWIRNLGKNITNSISGIDEGEIEGFFTSSHESRYMLFGDAQNYISCQPM
ncbi:PIR Superfamily Protein [Plasmodium ovale curtisi]|uniref:PIR Superfamily Protein n=1 Tax=Plasmodium ovale curtisi TaxID=864141 RepID=A0A1A8WS43_PLAOA|nr:PIR Superfamily Protein [Plasmodium ovale curtisi]